MLTGSPIIARIICAVLIAAQLTPSVWAKEYRIGADDVLEIRFWQDPTLNAQVRVGQDGKISLDVIGQIEAAGKTTEELQSDIVRQISRLNKNISQAVVRIVTFNYNYLFVTGQVNKAGKLTFEEIPDLWTVINEAGGINEQGDLTRVTLIRGGADAGTVEVVNVADAVASGQQNKLPRPRRMDTIEIPRTPADLPSADLARTTESKNLVFVVGAVNSPGPKLFEENTDLLGLLALAGGPSQNADLKKTKLITRDGYYSQTLQFNLSRQFDQNRPARYIVRREDTFVVPEKGGGLFGITLTNASVVIGVLTSAILLIDRFTDNSSNTTSTAR